MISSPKQRQLIGYFRILLKIDDDTYRDIIAYYNVNSTTQLSYSEANELLERLKMQAVGLGLYTPKSGNNWNKYENMAGRYGMATPKQLRKIEVMWKNISNKPNDFEKEKALNFFISRITGKQRLNFLTQTDVSKVIKAIETMEKQKAGNLYANC